MNARRILSTSAVATAAVLLSIGVQTLAYSAPTSAPTTVDADAPLNVGSTGQTKTGALTINGALAAAAITATGNISSQGKITADTAAGEGFCLGTSCITAWPNTTGFVSTDSSNQTKIGDLTLNPGSLIVTAGKIKVGTGTFTPAGAGLGVFGEFTFNDGTAGTNEVLTSKGAGGGSTWKNAVTELGLQKGVNATSPNTNPCSVGSSIIGIDPTTGAITCGKMMQSGIEVGESGTHNVTFSAMPDTSYSAIVQYEYGGTSNSSACFDPKITKGTKTTTGFSFHTGDNCNEPIYNWMVIDY